MSLTTPQIKKRSDYRAPEFQILSVDLSFELYEKHTLVTCVSRVERQGQHTLPLTLDGSELELSALKVDGLNYSDYHLSATHLVLENLPEQFELSVQTKLDPANNTSLEGLYQVSDSFCSQCEAEGFRKITYFLDRPDVLAEYTVTLHADKSKYPYLL